MKQTHKHILRVGMIIYPILFISGLVSLAQEKEVEEATIPIIKGDSTTNSSSFNAYPYVYYTPETSLAFGGGGIFVFYTGDSPELKPSKLGFGLMYSISKQYRIGLNPKFYFFDSKLYIETPLSYGYSIDKFFGIGPDTESTGNEKFAKKYFTASMTIQVPPVIFTALRTGIILDYEHTEITDKKENELLLNDEVTGSNGGHVFGIGGDLVWDTRDNLFFPTKGGYQYFKVLIYPDVGDYVFSFLELDVKQFYGFSSDMVLGGNFYLSSTTGDAPFYKLPALGGQKRMRGYFMGRYRDNFLMMLQAEFRHMFSKRFGYVVFGGAGNVSNSMLEYSLNHIKYSLGAGLRFRFNQKEKVNLRMDIGVGPDKNMGIYFGIEEAF
jgi:outer membrane protein assembly factor BamA